MYGCTPSSSRLFGRNGATRWAYFKAVEPMDTYAQITSLSKMRSSEVACSVSKLDSKTSKLKEPHGSLTPSVCSSFLFLLPGPKWSRVWYCKIEILRIPQLSCWFRPPQREEVNGRESAGAESEVWPAFGFVSRACILPWRREKGESFCSKGTVT
ncbi:hypothetical protein BDY19DRAFT_906959 [Irpex rosettiformis]|uniref:Uncharacterized protein n=1 Tax=Irpex rosettiformis TaxID=378272 RepID=A0ACB8U0T3_9APHY|nr:hypothetical protein BDY19DRAFT_906959 [Irpex rosettiformis]